MGDAIEIGNNAITIGDLPLTEIGRQVTRRGRALRTAGKKACPNLGAELFIELPVKLPSLRDPPPALQKHLTRCLRNRVQARPIGLLFESWLQCTIVVLPPQRGEVCLDARLRLDVAQVLAFPDGPIGVRLYPEGHAVGKRPPD